MGKTILIVEDEQNIVDILSFNLGREGYDTLEAYDGPTGLQLALENNPDLILLDLMLPGMDGFGVCRRVREAGSSTPIIMLTAREEETDKVLGLELGADDYITKPFSPREVVARIKAVLRRIHELTESSKGSHLVAGNLDIDMSAFIVKLGDEVIPCTPKEIEILWTLAGNPGMVFSREHLLQSIWGYDFLGDTRAVDSHIKRIRA